jgi:hypothetical protein
VSSPVLRLKESVPHQYSAEAVVFAAAARARADIVEMQAAHAENLGTIGLPLLDAGRRTLGTEPRLNRRSAMLALGL